MENENQRHVWTWADQVSTYRFWGLVLFHLYTLSSFIIFSQTYFRWADHMGQTPSTIGTIFSSFHILGFIGLIVGWIIIKFGNIKNLLILAVIQIIGILLLIFGGNPFLKIIGAGLWGLGYSSVFIVIPSAIAGGKAGMSTFASLYLIILLYERIQNFSFSAQLGYFFDFMSNIQSAVYSLFLTIPLILGIIFLLPVKSILFEEEPKDRIKLLELKSHNVLVVFLLNIIPFYYVYFMYRIHGQVANFSQSRRLLSKNGALWISLLFPITLPIITTTLYDVLEDYSNKNNIAINRKWLILLLTILFIPFFPIAGALIQSDLNKLISQKASS
jgi:hypothetical protein